MGKSKRHYEDKHYNLQQKTTIFDTVKTCESYIALKIMSKDFENVIKYWNSSNTTKCIVIEKLNNINNKKEHIKWTLEHISDLFNFACENQQIAFVLFIVLNFPDKYYAKIKMGQIADWCDLTNNEKFHIMSLHNKSFSRWWLKGFNICSQSTECIICYENTSDNVKTKCNHIFCRKCIGQHLQIKTDCPYCRTSLLCDRRGKSYDNVYHTTFRSLTDYLFTPTSLGIPLTQLNLTEFHYAGSGMRHNI